MNLTANFRLRALMAFLLLLSLGACDHLRNQEGEKQAFAQLPAAVKLRIQQESTGGTVKDTEKFAQGGKTLYGADLVVNGEDKRVLIAEDGTVVKRGIEEEDDD